MDLYFQYSETFFVQLLAFQKFVISLFLNYLLVFQSFNGHLATEERKKKDFERKKENSYTKKFETCSQRIQCNIVTCCEQLVSVSLLCNLDLEKIFKQNNKMTSDKTKRT